MTSKRTAVVIAIAGVLALALFSVTSVDAAAQKAAAQQDRSAKKPGGGGAGGGNGGGKPGGDVLDLATPQIAVPAGSSLALYAFDAGAGTYVRSWKSKALKGRRTYESVWIGDVDNDMADEVVGFTGALYFFENGSGGESAYVSDSLDPASGTYNPVRIGDVDGSSGNEVVVSLGDRVEVWKCDDAPSCKWVWSSDPDVINPPGKLVIGDANTDGVDDFIVGTRSTGWNAFGSVRVYTKNVGPGWLETESEPVFDPPAEYGATVGRIAVGDVDGDGDNEIVATVTKWGQTAGDSEAWLAIWKWDGADYVLWHCERRASNAFGGGVDTADFNGNGIDEVVVGVNSGLLSTVVVLEFAGVDESAEPVFNEVFSSMLGAFAGPVRVGDTDGDDDLEFVVGAGKRIQIYDDSGSGFEQIYASPEDREILDISIQ